MSEPTLNKHGDQMDVWLISRAATETSTRGRKQFTDWVERDVARHVKRCKHGNIDPHIVNGYVPVDTETCPGAGIGDINEPTIGHYPYKNHKDDPRTEPVRSRDWPNPIEFEETE